MQRNIHMPQVELSMEGIKVISWLVEAGQFVQAEQALLEVETQKAVIDVPSPEPGYLRQLCASKGDTVGEGSLLCILTDTADEAFQNTEVEVYAAPSGQTKEILNTSIVPAAPAARRLASDLGIDLSRVEGRGPEGRIRVEDVQEFQRQISAPQTSVAVNGGWSLLPASRIALNEQMLRGLREIPQIHVVRQVDVSALFRKSEMITFTQRLIYAAARALSRHPRLRTIISGNSVKVEPVSIALAIDTPHGLMAPGLRNADTLSAEQLRDYVNDLRKRADANSIKREELLGFPFAISNLGMLQVDLFNASIFYGQTAVLAVGRAIVDSTGRKVAWFSLGADHRVVDGAEAARFLLALQEEILKL